MSGTSMLYVVAYDIPNDRRRAKLFKLLSGFGERTQYSLFECFLDNTELVKLRAGLASLLIPEEDSVRIYPLNAACLKAVETVGGSPPEEKTIYVI